MTELAANDLASIYPKPTPRVIAKARPEIDYNAAHKLFLNLSCASVAGCIPEQYWDKLSAMAQFLRRKKDNSSELAAVLNGYTDTHREWIRLDLVRNHLRAAWASFFRDYDVLLCPVAATAAQPHDQSSKIDRFRKIIVNGKPVAASEQWFWAGLPAVAYLPATVAPAGFTASGLPVGVQIIGPQYGDHTCLAFARLLEQEYQAFVPPKGWA